MESSSEISIGCFLMTASQCSFVVEFPHGVEGRPVLVFNQLEAPMVKECSL